MGSIGYYDPDQEDFGSRQRPGWSKPKTKLQEAALLATGHRRRDGTPGFFSSQLHKKRFKAVEEKALGADEESILMQEWIKHNIGICQIANRVKVTRPMGILLAMLENEDRRIDWIASNREKIMTKRHEVAKDIFFGSKGPNP